MYNLTIGVKELLEILYHPDSLGERFNSSERATEGIEGHRLIRDRRPKEYRSEIPVEFEYAWDEYLLTIRGRIDGMLETEDTIELEEIKTTYTPLESLSSNTYPIHEAQLKLYIYFLQTTLPQKTVFGKLTYLNLDDLSEKSFEIKITETEGAVLLSSLAAPYLAGIKNRHLWRELRNHSLNSWDFPFPQKRMGQEELLDGVQQALDTETPLFLEAATGIGKTIGVLYPTLKNLAKTNRYDQVFFLTAKTAGKEIIKKTLLRAGEQGLHLRSVFIEAKERVCLHPDCECTPESCPCASGYYIRSAEILPDLLAAELILPETIAEIAQKYELCPFELSLDLSLFADLIIGDYNYVFDPTVYLKRFFQGEKRHDFVFLVDEAHNLVQRGREMYSALLSQNQLQTLRDNLINSDKYLLETIEKLADFFALWQNQLREDNRQGMLLTQLPEMFEPTLARLISLVEQWLTENRHAENNKAVRELFFELLDMLRTIGYLCPEYAIYLLNEQGNLVLRLYCRNPASLLRKRLELARTTIFFSATLSPPEYFQRLLIGNTDAQSLKLLSPFPQENRLYLQIPGVDTRFKQREQSAEKLAKIAVDMALAHHGNYMAFFPSYAYLNAVKPLIQHLAGSKIDVFSQSPKMSDRQKQAFLRRVTDTSRNCSGLGLAVLGGIFGEGVDMPGDSLIGVLIVGPGLPTISAEQELIQMWFQEQENAGFLYAYMIPGIIRVIQSAGRVFRGPNDRGLVLLVDDRFLQEEYRDLLPPDWFLAGRPFSEENYQKAITDFWDDTP